MAALALAFDILARDKASKAFDDVGRSVDRTADKSSKLGTALKAGFAVAGVAVAGFLAEGVRSLARIEQIGAQTDAAIKSTGGAAGVTREQIESLAGSIERMSGIEAEAIQEGQNLLLTFTNIQGVNFDRATTALVDMSVALGTDAAGSAVQLGKALNDPIKGIASLGRAGVQFTAEQKASITAMAEAGDVAGAQTVILAELEKQFGGSAKAAGQTLGGQLAIAKNRFGEVQEELAAKLIPALSTFLDKTIQAIDFVQRNQAVIVPLVGALAGLAAVVVTVNATMTAAAAITAAWTAVSKLHIASVVAHSAALVANRLVVAAVMTAYGLLTAAQVVATGAQAALNAVLAANPIGLVVAAIALLVAGFVLAYKNSETFRDIVNGAFAAVKAGASALVLASVEGFRFLLNTWLTVAEGIVTGAAKAFGWVPGIGPKLQGAASAISGFRDQANRALDSVRDSVRIDADTSPADRALAGLVSRIGRANGTVTISARAVERATTGKWAGGPVSGGRAVRVGEMGPELIVPSRDAYVLTAQQTRNLDRRDDMPASRPSRSGPAVVVQSATFTDGADLDLLFARAEFAMAGGRLG